MVPERLGKLLSVTNCVKDALNQSRCGTEIGKMSQYRVHYILKTTFLSVR
jgi:hypothetical protein